MFKPNSGFFIDFDDVIYKCKLSGKITADPGTSRQTLLAYRRSDGELIGACVWDDSTHEYELFLQEHSDENIMLTRRDDAGVFFAETYDRLSLCQHVTSQPAEYVPDRDGKRIDVAHTYNVTSYPSTIVHENLFHGVDSGRVVYLDSLESGNLYNDIISCKLPRKARGILTTQRDKFLCSEGSIGIADIEYVLNKDPFNDGSLLAGYSLRHSTRDFAQRVDGEYVLYNFNKGMYHYIGLAGKDTLGIPTDIYFDRASAKTVYIYIDFVSNYNSTTVHLIHVPQVFILSIYSNRFEYMSMNGTTLTTASYTLPSPYYGKYHIAVVFNTSGNDVVYINGVARITKAVGIPTTPRAKLPLYFLGNHPGTHNIVVQNCAVFDRALSISEINSLSTAFYTTINNEIPIPEMTKFDQGSVGLIKSFTENPHMHIGVDDRTVLHYIQSDTNIIDNGVTIRTDHLQFDGTTGALYRTAQLDFDDFALCIQFKHLLRGATQCIWKIGDSVNGASVCIDASGILSLYVRSNGALTSATITTEIIVGAVYILVLSLSSIRLYSESQELLEDKLHGLLLGEYSGYESIGVSYDSSLITGTAGTAHYFNGNIYAHVLTEDTSFESRPYIQAGSFSAWIGNTELPIEIVSIDNINKRSIVWTKIPKFEGNTNILLRKYPSSKWGYTGSDAASLVWDASFIAVYHMVPDSVQLIDSTANKYNGILVNIDESNFGNTLTGPILNFNGIDEYVLLSDQLITNAQRCSISILFNAATVPAGLYSGMYNVDDVQCNISIDTLSNLNFALYDSNEVEVGVGEVGTTTGSDNLVTMAYTGRGTSNAITVQLNNNASSQFVGSGSRVCEYPTSTYLGRDANNNFLHGSIGEVIISNKSRSSLYNSLVYGSVSDTLCAYSKESSGALAKIELSPPLATITNYPLKVIFSESSGVLGTDCSSIFSVIQESFRNLHITTDYGVSCAIEVTVWDYENKHAELYVCVPEIKVGTQTVLYVEYIGYVNSDVCTSSEDTSGVWDSSFAGVWHFSEDADYAPYLVDSTNNNNHFSNPVSTSAGSLSEYGDSISVVNSSPFPAASDSDSLDLSAAISVELAVKFPAFSNWGTLLAKGYDNSYEIKGQNSSFTFRIKSNADHAVTLSTTANSWQYLAGTYTSGSLLGYNNGIQVGVNSAPTGLLGNSSSPLALCTDHSSGINASGHFSELWISNVVRGPEWIDYSYRAWRDQVNSIVILGVAWNPSMIADLSIWLDANDDSTVIMSGAYVTQWNDKSGNARHAIAKNTSYVRKVAWPYNTNSNAISIAKYGSLGGAYSTTLTNQSVFVVFIPRTNCDPFARVFTQSDALPDYTTTGGYVPIRRYNSPQYASECVGKSPNNAGTHPVDDNTAVLFESIHTDTNVINIKNGSISAGDAHALNKQFTNYRIGAIAPSGGGDYFDGYVAEIIILDRVVTELERKNIEGYLAHKWSIASLLDADHTWATEPPTVGESASVLNISQDIALWLDSTDISSLDVRAGGKVNTWGDNSLYGLDAQQSTDSLRPVFYPGQGIYFDKTTYFTMLSNYLYVNPEQIAVSIFAVVVPYADNTQTVSRFIFDFGMNANYGYGVGCSSVGIYGYAASGLSSTPISMELLQYPHIVCLTITLGELLRLYVNNTLMGENINVGSALSSSTLNESPTRYVDGGPVCIGAQSKTHNDVDRYFYGMIKELIVIRGSMDDLSKDRIYTYLHSKFIDSEISTGNINCNISAEVSVPEHNVPVMLTITESSGINSFNVFDILAHSSSLFYETNQQIHKFGIHNNGLCGFNTSISTCNNQLGVNGKAGEFINKYLDVSNVVSRLFLISKNISVSIWVNVKFNPTATEVLIFGTTTASEFQLLVRQGYGELVYRHTSSGYIVGYSCPDKWTHILITRNSASDVITYINGRYASLNTYTVAPSTSSSPIQIGSSAFIGAIGDIDLFRRCLSAEEAQALYLSSNYGGVDYVDIHTTLIETIPSVLLGEELTSVHVNSLSVNTRYSLSFNNSATFYVYIGEEWIPIVTADVSIHGYTGETAYYYWDYSTSEWVYSGTSVYNAISSALEYEENSMYGHVLNECPIFPSVSETGTFTVAVSMRDQAEEVSSIIINNKNYWVSEEYVLSDFCETVSKSSVSYAYQIPDGTADYKTATKLYCWITGGTSWVECVDGTIPNVPVGLTTTGKSIKFRLVWDLDIWIDPKDVVIEFTIK